MQPHSTGDEPIPGYRLARFLGQGGYGQVWAASGPGGIDIALKILSITGTRGGKELRAIGLVKKLRHPNLVPLYAYWIKDEFGNTVDGAAYETQSLRGEATELIIAMGLGDKSLATRLEECKKAGLTGVPIEELLRYIDGAAKAIDFLNQPIHHLGSGTPIAVSHCDIKPGNLLIVGNEVQLCDYGLARAITPDVRATAATGAGTQAYSSPEMLANRPSDHSDQYSLAISYYELRTGVLPFPENEALHAHIQGRLDFSKAAPTEQEVLKKATHLDPAQRFPTAADFLQALREANKISGGAGSGFPKTGSSPSSTPSVRMPILDDKLRAGAELLPHYELVKLLGRGGYGEVWQAQGPGGISCALKIVRNLDGMQGKQEYRSLELVKELDHERLVRLQAYWLLARDGTDIPYKQLGQPGAPEPHALVMATELASKSLLQYWQEFQNQGRSNIPVTDLMRITRQTAEAIDYLNERDILHRDIKPENILLTKDLKVKVSDFGLAKLLEGSGAAIHQASVGLTLAYAAPELFDNRVSRWTDQYALALTYYRLRTGNFPFPNDFGPRQMMLAHTEGRLEFAGIRPEEERVLRKATSLDPQGRYPNCLTFVEALEQAHGMSTPLVGPGSRGSDFSIPPGGKPGVRAGSRGDDPRRTLVQDFTAGALPQTDSRTEAFIGGPSVTVATDSQVMAELVESASVKETPGGHSDLQATIIPQALPLLTKKSGPRRVAMPTPDVDEIIHQSQAQKWKKLAILGGGSAVAVGLITFVAIKMMTPSGGGTPGSPDAPPVIVKGDEPPPPPIVPPQKPKDLLVGPINTETVEGKLTSEVKRLVDAKNFAGAAAAIAVARQKNVKKDVCDSLDRSVLENWRFFALDQKELPRRIEIGQQILKAYAADSKRDSAVETERLAVVQDLAAAEIDVRIAAADFAGALQLADAAQADQRLKPDRADAIRSRLASEWRGDTARKLAEARAISDMAKRLAALDALLGRMPKAENNAELRAMRQTVLKDRVATAVEQFRSAKNFAAAAAAVKAARTEKVDSNWADAQDDSIRSDWRRDAAGKPSLDDQKVEYDRLLATYPGYRNAEIERTEVERLIGVRYASEGAKKFRELVKDLRPDTLAKTRADLQAFLKKGLTPDLQGQVQNLLTKIDEFEKDRARPADVATFELLAGKADAGKSSNEEQIAVAGLYQGQVEQTARELVRTVNAKTDWTKLEAATRRFKSPWCESLHAEAVAEMLAKEQRSPSAEQVLPVGSATGDLKGYREYLSATGHQNADEIIKLGSAADQPSWASPHRFALMYRILREKAAALKADDASKSPFTDADAAFGLLSAAEKLASRADLKLPPDQTARLQLELALAALTKPKPDVPFARQRLDKLMSGGGIKSLQLGKSEEAMVQWALARTRDAGPAGRVAAISGYLQILEQTRESLAGVPKEFLVAELFEPLSRDNGKAIIGGAVDPSIRGPAARLYFDAARNLVRFRGDWSREPGRIADPIATALQFLNRAVALKPSSDELAWRGLVQLEQSQPNLKLAVEDADAATKADENGLAALVLRGAVDFWQGRGFSDYAKRVERCKVADDEFAKAEKLAGNQADKKDILLFLYKYASENAIQIANAIPSPQEQSRYLDRAIAMAQKLLDLDDTRFDARDAKGCALEDKAWLVKTPDRFGETGAYAQAIAAFTEALNGLDARAVAEMHRGRCRFKLLEDLGNQTQGPKLSPERISELLAEARNDLASAIGKLDGNKDALEAHFWKAKLNLLRYSWNLAPPDEAYDEAAKEFKAALQVAQKLGQELWREPITLEWAMAAEKDAARLAGKKGAEARFEARLKEAIDLAESAKSFSKPWYAYLRMRLLPLERTTGSRGKQYYDDLSGRAADGLGDARPQDRVTQFRILALRSAIRSFLDVPFEAVNPALALADAQAAEKLAREASLSQDDRSYAAGLAGMAHLRTVIAERGEKQESAREKARADFKRAIELSPKGATAWQWKALLAVATKLPNLESPTAVTDYAAYAAEVYPLLREAEELAPKPALMSGHDRKVIESIKQSRDVIEKNKYSESLATAIGKNPEHPDRAAWQLTLADMLVATGGSAAEIRELFEAGQKGLSPAARKLHENQIRRIEQALKTRK